MGRIAMAVAACFLLSAAGALDADSEKPADHASSGADSCAPSIAVLDVAKVLRECGYFKQQMGELDIEVAAERKRMKRKAEELALGANPEDPLATGLPNREAWKEFRNEATRLRRSFLRREGTIYRTVYDALQDQAKKYCQEKGLMGPIDLGTLKQGTATPEVVDSLDITEETLRRLNGHFADQKRASEKLASREGRGADSSQAANENENALAEDGGDDGQATLRCHRERTEERRR